jgi:hypothetical protein
MAIYQSNAAVFITHTKNGQQSLCYFLWAAIMFALLMLRMLVHLMMRVRFLTAYNNDMSAINLYHCIAE